MLSLTIFGWNVYHIYSKQKLLEKSWVAHVSCPQVSVGIIGKFEVEIKEMIIIR